MPSTCSAASPVRVPLIRSAPTKLGRDLLLRLLYGGQVSLFVGLVGALAAALLGTVIGLVAGYAGGRTDALLMRLTGAVIARRPPGAGRDFLGARARLRARRRRAARAAAAHHDTAMCCPTSSRQSSSPRPCRSPM
jgi:hypothetical protein